MATPERPGAEPVIEQRSRIKISETAKGEPRFDVSVVEGADAGELERMRTLAITTYQELGKALVVARGGQPTPAVAGPGDGDAEPGPS